MIILPAFVSGGCWNLAVSVVLCLTHLVLQSYCSITMLPVDSVLVCVKGRGKIVCKHLSVKELPRFRSELLLSHSAVRSVETS